jgi:glycine/D-amino acid oxidase-like deaminating enzyme
MTIRQSALRGGTSIWLKGTRVSPPRYPRLRGHHDVEVAIVGGGITGALVAETFARHGVSVAVLEGGLVGRGSTAASSALLLQEPDSGLGELTDRYGAGAAVRIWQLCRAGVRDLVTTLHRLRISCGVSKSDVVHYATTADAATLLKAEFDRRKQAGFGGRWLTPDALRRATAIAGFGGIRTTGHARLDPYAACLGLLASAAHRGAAVFERSGVSRVRQAGAHVRLYTRTGTVDARRVVVATGYATERFRPLAGRFTMYRTYVLATRRFTPAQRRRLGLGNVMVWDTERPYHYARWTADGRLLLGGADRRVVPGRRREVEFVNATLELRGDFESLFPSLSDVAQETAWDGLFALTPDSLPYIGTHQRYPRHLFALGYGGNGMTFGSLAARLLLEHWQGVRSPDQALFAFGRLRSRDPRRPARQASK